MERVGFNPIGYLPTSLMRTTQQFSITLTNEMADAVKAKVQAGEYATESEVIRDGLRALLARYFQRMKGIVESHADLGWSRTAEEFERLYEQIAGRRHDSRPSAAAHRRLATRELWGRVVAA